MWPGQPNTSEMIACKRDITQRRVKLVFFGRNRSRARVRSKQDFRQRLFEIRFTPETLGGVIRGIPQEQGDRGIQRREPLLAAD